jgi:CBS domain-containing protein
MNIPVVSASPGDTVRDIAKKMKEEKIGSIVIMDKNRPVGIVTDWDIVSGGVTKDIRPSEIKAADVMKEIHTIESEAAITEAARLLKAQHKATWSGLQEQAGRDNFFLRCHCGDA